VALVLPVPPKRATVRVKCDPTTLLRWEQIVVDCRFGTLHLRDQEDVLVRAMEALRRELGRPNAGMG